MCIFFICNLFLYTELIFNYFDCLIDNVDSDNRKNTYLLTNNLIFTSISNCGGHIVEVKTKPHVQSLQIPT